MRVRIDLADPSFKANPYPAYARLRDEAPCHRVRLGWRRRAWLVSRYADVAALLRDPRFAKDPASARGGGAPWLPPSLRPLARNMLDLDAPDHTRLRALVQKSFTPRLVEALRPRIESLVGELIDGMLRDGRGDLVRQLALPVPLTIIAELLGIPPADRARFHAWSSRIVSGTPDLRAVLVIPAVRAMFRYLRTLFAARRAGPRDDLVSALVHAEAE